MSASGAARARSAGLARLDELAAEQGIELERDVSLAPLTTLRVGGPADRLVLARSREALVGARGVVRLMETRGFCDVRYDPVLGGLMAIHHARKARTSG